MEKLIVSRDDTVYECFPDIAQTPDGTLVCTYRESAAHIPWSFSRIVVRRSEDLGRTWLPKRILIEKQSENAEGRLNCPRITACADGSLLLVVDLMSHAKHELMEDPGEILLFRSEDSGRTWRGPEATGITDGTVPAIKQLSNGHLLLGVTRGRMPEGMSWEDGLSAATQEQTAYLSADGGSSWQGPYAVPDPLSLHLNEGDFAELDDGTIVCYMREDRERLSGWKSVSTDGGRTWSAAFRSEIRSCLGRPSVGRLRSGEIAVTYRFLCGVCTSLALYVETPEEAIRGARTDAVRRETAYCQARFAFLANDRSLHPDCGYSGWVQLPGGALYVVDYVNDDAPRAQIRGYVVQRDDWFLFPEGAIPWVDEGTGRPYVEISERLAHEQRARNRGREWPTRVPTHK